MRFTPSEIFFAERFAERISNNRIDSRDFMDSRNVERTPFKVIQDNRKGKLAEYLYAI